MCRSADVAARIYTFALPFPLLLALLSLSPQLLTFFVYLCLKFWYQGKDGLEAVHLAVAEGNVLAVDFLLRFGVSPDGLLGAHTPLQVAAQLDRAEVAKVLLAHGANTAYANASGASALDIANKVNSVRCAYLLAAYDDGVLDLTNEVVQVPGWVAEPLGSLSGTEARSPPTSLATSPPMGGLAMSLGVGLSTSPRGGLARPPPPLFNDKDRAREPATPVQRGRPPPPALRQHPSLSPDMRSDPIPITTAGGRGALPRPRSADSLSRADVDAAAATTHAPMGGLISPPQMRAPVPDSPTRPKRRSDPAPVSQESGVFGQLENERDASEGDDWDGLVEPLYARIDDLDLAGDGERMGVAHEGAEAYEGAEDSGIKPRPARPAPPPPPPAGRTVVEGSADASRALAAATLAAAGAAEGRPVTPSWGPQQASAKASPPRTQEQEEEPIYVGFGLLAAALADENGLDDADDATMAQLVAAASTLSTPRPSVSDGADKRGSVTSTTSAGSREWRLTRVAPPPPPPPPPPTSALEVEGDNEVQNEPLPTRNQLRPAPEPSASMLASAHSSRSGNALTSPQASHANRLRSPGGTGSRGSRSSCEGQHEQEGPPPPREQPSPGQTVQPTMAESLVAIPPRPTDPTAPAALPAGVSQRSGRGNGGPARPGAFDLPPPPAELLADACEMLPPPPPELALDATDYESQGMRSTRSATMPAEFASRQKPLPPAPPPGSASAAAQAEAPLVAKTGKLAPRGMVSHRRSRRGTAPGGARERTQSGAARLEGEPVPDGRPRRPPLPSRPGILVSENSFAREGAETVPPAKAPRAAASKPMAPARPPRPSKAAILGLDPAPAPPQ